MRTPRVTLIAVTLLPLLLAGVVPATATPAGPGATAAGPAVSASLLAGAGRTAIVVERPLAPGEVPAAAADRRLLPRTGVERFTVPTGAADGVLAGLRARGVQAWRDRLVRAARVPDDPAYDGQWEHQNINVEPAWDRTIGSSSTIVAVLDTGVLASHPDLSGALVGGYDLVNGDTDPHDDDPEGHGTSVAGVVAARSDNGTGVASVCWRCRIMPVKVLDHRGAGFMSDVAEGIVYAVDHGADVINLSLTSFEEDVYDASVQDPPPTTRQAVDHAAARDVVVVAAAGNSADRTIQYPAVYDSVLSVSANDAADRRDAYATYGDWVDVTAPGCVTTTASSDGVPGYVGGVCGTSFASPMVAGLAGLIRSIRPDLRATDVVRAIEEGAEPVGYVRHGRIDADRSVPVAAVSGALYRALTPARLLDTRTSLGGHRGPLGSRQTLRLDVTGVGGVPSTGATAVVLNVTATGPTDESYLTVSPRGSDRPTASNLNVVRGQTVANLVTVPVGYRGEVNVYNHQGDVHVVADVVGYYVAGGGGAMFRALDPARVVDTRDGTGTGAMPVGAGEHRSLRIAGRGGVPRDGVTAVAVNVTAVDGTARSHLTVYPDGAAMPATSTLNFGPGDVVPNMAIATLGTDGRIRVFNNAGAVDVVVDVLGYFTLNEAGSRFHALTPARAVDTRSGTGGPASAIGNRATRTVDLTGVAGVPSSGVTSVVTNVTGVRPTASLTYLTLSPDGTPRPGVSTVNLRRGQVRPNMAMVTVGPGGLVDVYNHSGSTDVVIDVSGYFTGG